MSKSTQLDCNGCNISMFCSRKDNKEGEPCETNLKAVALAFVIPLCGMVLLLVLAQGRMSDGVAALAILCFLVIYFLVIRLLKLDFSGKRNN